MYSTGDSIVSWTTRVISRASACFCSSVRPSRMSHWMTGTVTLLSLPGLRSQQHEVYYEYEPDYRSSPPRSNFVNICLDSSVRVVRRIRVADRYDGQDSSLLQAPGVRVPELGDLRRHTLFLRLRPP